MSTRYPDLNQSLKDIDLPTQWRWSRLMKETKSSGAPGEEEEEYEIEPKPRIDPRKLKSMQRPPKFCSPNCLTCLARGHQS